MIEIPESLPGPKPLLQFFPCDQMSGSFEKNDQHLKGLPLQDDRAAIDTKFSGLEIKLKFAEANVVWKRARHRRLSLSERFYHQPVLRNTGRNPATNMQGVDPQGA